MAHHYIGFFDRLCEEYAAGGGQPLQLRSLRCGQAVHPMNHDSLAKLANLKHLEEVEICNHELWGVGGVQLIGLYSADGSRSGITFQSFLPRHCPRLRRFFVSQYRFDVYELLCAVSEEPSFSKKLAVFIEQLDRPGHRDPWILLQPKTQHPGLPIQLRMLAFQRNTGLLRWSSRGTENGFLEDLVATNADSLEGLMLQLDEKLGEPLPDTGMGGDLWDIPPIEELWSVPPLACTICGLDAVESAIRSLPRLRQLSISSTRKERDGTPNLALKTARRLALAGHGLVYINIYDRFWRVNRQQGGVVELERLTPREVRDVELFHYFVSRTPHIWLDVFGPVIGRTKSPQARIGGTDMYIAPADRSRSWLLSNAILARGHW